VPAVSTSDIVRVDVVAPATSDASSVDAELFVFHWYVSVPSVVVASVYRLPSLPTFIIDIAAGCSSIVITADGFAFGSNVIRGSIASTYESYPVSLVLSTLHCISISPIPSVLAAPPSNVKVTFSFNIPTANSSPFVAL